MAHRRHKYVYSIIFIIQLIKYPNHRSVPLLHSSDGLVIILLMVRHTSSMLLRARAHLEYCFSYFNYKDIFLIFQSRYFFNIIISQRPNGWSESGASPIFSPQPNTVGFGLDSLLDSQKTFLKTVVYSFGTRSMWFQMTPAKAAPLQCSIISTPPNAFFPEIFNSPVDMEVYCCKKYNYGKAIYLDLSSRWPATKWSCRDENIERPASEKDDHSHRCRT